MSGFTVSYNITLRNYYSSYRAFASKTNRESATDNQLTYADSLALRRAVKKLADYDFDDEDQTGTASQLRAFVDTVNYTMESAKTSDDTYVASAYKGIKNTLSKYSSELENIGITTGSSGYLKLSSTAATNLSASTFKNFFKSDSTLMKSLSSYAKRIYNHVDYYA